MKLFRIVILVGALIVAAAAQNQCPASEYVPFALNCTNKANDVSCEDYFNNPGCGNLGIRLNCRKKCDVCNSFENERPKSDVAVLYGGNHVLTWDRLPFDCTGMGEFILYTNHKTGMKVHALLTRPKRGGNSVPTAVAAINSGGEKRLQISVDRAASNQQQRCSLLFWVGAEAVTKEQAGELGGYKGIAQLYDPSAPDRLEYKLDLRSGAQIRVAVRYGKEQGCYFEQVKVLLIACLKSGTRGLLGTPDNNIYNDWHGKNGSIFNLPNRLGRYLRPAYNYVRNVWCVRYVSGSIIKYDRLGNFASNQNCSAEYDGPSNLSPDNDEAGKVCGEFNYECLQESRSTKAAEGIQTLRMMAETEEETVPEFKNGLNVQPRGIPVDRPWKITVALRYGSFVPGLNGFGLVELDGDSLIRSRRVIAFLTDDGDRAKGDAKRLDKYFTDQISVTLGNGHSKGYAAVPLINGVYSFDRENLIVSLPDAVRGYSVASERSEAKAQAHLPQITRRSIQDLIVDLRLEGPLDRQAIIVGARFLDEYVGDEACGTDYDKTDYLSCKNCRTGAVGEVPRLSFRLGRAKAHGKFITSTELALEGFFLGSIWCMDNPPSVPVNITASLRIGEQRLQSLRITVPARQKIIEEDIDEDSRLESRSYCTKEFEDTLLATLRIVKTGIKWVISFLDSHIPIPPGLEECTTNSTTLS